MDDSETRILFTDTNGFLQVKDLKDIPWKDLFPGVKAVDVMVAPSVINELDKHKTGTNQRRRDRARLALQLIKKASSEPDFALVIRDHPIRVRIVISRAPRFKWTEHANLDPSNPDDQLVAEALSFGNGAAIFSHDTGPLIRAAIAKIKAYEPAAEWLLPVEQTDDQRKITQLERNLKQALSQRPIIIAAFENFDEATSEIRLLRPVLKPLNAKVGHRLATAYLEKRPRASVYPTNSMWQAVGGISESQVDCYHADYSSFEEKVRDHYAKLHEHVWHVGTAAAIGYYIINDSSVVAEGLRIEFDVEGSGSLLASREDAAEYIGLLKPPKPPKEPRSLDYLHSPISVPDIRDAMKPRDPVAFYWFERPEIGAKHSALQCEQFRATREYYDTIFVLALDELPAQFDLHLHVEAANLPAPVDIAAKVIIAEQAVEWSDPVVQAILPEGIRELVV
ncbi:PIN domain-containing protein [Bradyrhizobium sp. AZCC 2289]|uniref:PIN domain-containing protein n=1 Tax=Bradyrhizobium sp. AZCC 2289 TaxID=3117026 RepID=UPI002FF41BB0